MEVNVDMLEQMDLMDMSDHEALDVFLHSGGEDINAASPVAGGKTRQMHIIQSDYNAHNIIRAGKKFFRKKRAETGILRRLTSVMFRRDAPHLLGN